MCSSLSIQSLYTLAFAVGHCFCKCQYCSTINLKIHFSFSFRVSFWPSLYFLLFFMETSCFFKEAIPLRQTASHAWKHLLLAVCVDWIAQAVCFWQLTLKCNSFFQSLVVLSYTWLHRCLLFFVKETFVRQSYSHGIQGLAISLK